MLMTDNILEVAKDHKCDKVGLLEISRSLTQPERDPCLIIELFRFSISTSTALELFSCFLVLQWLLYLKLDLLRFSSCASLWSSISDVELCRFLFEFRPKLFTFNRNYSLPHAIFA